MNLGEYLVQEGTRIGQEAIDGVHSGRIRNVGELEAFVNRGLGQTADDITALVSGASSPMVQSMMASMQPTIMNVLTAYTPTFAAVTGGLLALSVLLGVWVAQETYVRGR
jgi:hypothetical protein